MSIDTNVIQNVGVIRELFKELRSFHSATLPGLISQVGRSLSAENVVRAYYQVKRFRSVAVSILQGVTQSELDAAHARETGLQGGIHADLVSLNASIQTFLTLVESNQSAIFATMTLGSNFASYGDLTTAQRNAVQASLQSIAAHFDG